MNRRMQKAKAAQKFHAAMWRRCLRGFVDEVFPMIAQQVVMESALRMINDVSDVIASFARAAAAAREAQRAMSEFGHVIDGECTRMSSGRFATPPPIQRAENGHEIVLPAGQLYVRQEDCGIQHAGKTGTIHLRLGHDFGGAGD